MPRTEVFELLGPPNDSAQSLACAWYGWNYKGVHAEKRMVWIAFCGSNKVGKLTSIEITANK